MLNRLNAFSNCLHGVQTVGLVHLKQQKSVSSVKEYKNTHIGHGDPISDMFSQFGDILKSREWQMAYSRHYAMHYPFTKHCCTLDGNWTVLNAQIVSTAEMPKIAQEFVLVWW